MVTGPGGGRGDGVQGGTPGLDQPEHRGQLVTAVHGAGDVNDRLVPVDEHAEPGVTRADGAPRHERDQTHDAHCTAITGCSQR